MLSDIRGGRIDAVVAYSSSRLYRRPANLQELIELDKQRKLKIATVVSGDLDLNTPDGPLIAGILAQVDQGEVERTGERVGRARAQRARDGIWHGGGRRPFGWPRRFTTSANLCAGNPSLGRARRTRYLPTFVSSTRDWKTWPTRLLTAAR
jgi:DNA invertase Pin-like site-specific DNA recombinase